MLAPRAHTALTASRADIGARFCAEERVLELIHTGIGKQQGRIVGRNQGATLNACVLMLFKIDQKGLTYLYGLHTQSRLC